MTVKSGSIRAIFTNILFLTGVGFLLFGFINGSLTVSRILTFDNYPLRNYEENRCDYLVAPIENVTLPGGPTTKNGVDQKELISNQAKRCKEKLEHDRKVRKTEDIVSSVTALVAGTVLVVGFRRSIFK